MTEPAPGARESAADYLRRVERIPYPEANEEGRDLCRKMDAYAAAKDARIAELEQRLGDAARAIPEVAGPVDHRIRMIRTQLSQAATDAEAEAERLRERVTELETNGVVGKLTAEIRDLRCRLQELLAFAKAHAALHLCSGKECPWCISIGKAEAALAATAIQENK